MLTILWDNDGVLVDTERFYFAASRQALARVDTELTPEAFAEISLRQGESVFQLAADNGIDGETIEQLRHWRNERYADYLRTEPCVIDGVAAVLEQLSGVCDMGIVTNSRKDHFDIVHSRSGLLDYFDFVISGEDFQRSKPHPEPYLTALERHELDRDRCLVVEDTQRGLRSAVAAGLPCVVVATELAADSDFTGAVAVIPSIRDLPARIEQLRIL